MFAPRTEGLWAALLVVAGICTGPAAACAQTFVGHHVVMGRVPVPVIGDVETRTDTWVLVTVRQQGDVMRWTQRTCKLQMAPVAGVRSSLPEATLAKLPPADIRLDRAADGRWRGAWDTHWSAADLDGDGHPGVSVQVDVPLCKGQVYVAAQTHSIATASWVGHAILGELRVTMQQRVLGASNVCLRLGPKQQRQVFDGVFLMVPVSNVNQCADISDDAWPSVMQNPHDL